MKHLKKLLIEAICIRNRQIINKKYHEKRMQQAIADCWQTDADIHLSDIIELQSLQTNVTYKCRITYSDKIHRVVFEKYAPRNINSLRIVDAENVNYRYKFADRALINNLREKRNEFDDILMVKNGMITDTSFTNIIFFDGRKWVTPSDFLLNGTMRQFLLDINRIAEKPIGVADLKKYSKTMLINAMLPFDESRSFSVSNIKY